MENRRRHFVAAVGFVALFSPAACSNSTSASGGHAFGPGSLRFINASPYLGNVDVAVGTAGKPFWTNVPYASRYVGGHNIGITAWAQFSTPAPSIFIYRAGHDGTPIPLNLTSVTLLPNSRVTLVFYGDKGLHRLVSFSEHIFSSGPGMASVSFHHASLTVDGSPFLVGYAPLGSPSQQHQIGTVFSPRQNCCAFADNLPQGIASTGIMFYAQDVQPGIPTFTLLPSQVDPSDSLSVMPNPANGNSNADQNLSLYLVDGLGPPLGFPTLIGVFDPNN
jgi:hypothetical protein